MSQLSPSGPHQAGPPPAALQDFPIWRGVTEAFRRTFANMAYFPAAAALPVILTVILNIFSIRLVMDARAAPEGIHPMTGLLLLFLSYCPYILFSVAWFRLALLGAEQGRPGFFSGWKLRHWRFLRFVLAMLGMAMIAGMVVTMVLSLIFGLFYGAGNLAVDGGLGVSLFLVAFFVTATIMIAMLRFSFVFPAAAVDEAYGLAMSWRHTKGQALRLFVAMLLIAVPFAMATSVIGGIFGSPFEVRGSEGEAGGALPDIAFGPNFYVLEGLLVVLGYLLTAVIIEMIGLAFRICTGWVPDDGAGPPALHDESASN